MTRSSLGTINPATTSGTMLASMLSSRDAAENSSHSGTGRPSYATEGMIYIDTTTGAPRMMMAIGVSGPDIDLTTLFSPPPGTLRTTAAVRLATGWLWADGSLQSRTTYAALLNAICPLFTGTVTSASATITAVSEDLRFLGLIGAKLEGSGIPANTTITAITASTITMSAVATGSFTATSVRAFPHGNGNGSTTFGLPNAKGRVIIGRSDMAGTDAGLVTVAGGAGFDGSVLGASGGAQGVTLTAAQIAGHTHPASSSAALVSGSTGTETVNHRHTVPLAETGPTPGIYALWGGNPTGYVDTTSVENAVHTHIINSLVMTVTTTVSNNVGGDGLHTNTQPSIIENVCIKV